MLAVQLINYIGYKKGFLFVLTSWLYLVSPNVRF